MILSWQQIASSVVSELMCEGFDGVVIDTEHGCFNNETIFSCIQTIKLKNKKAFVRLTEPSLTLTRYCLDAGCDGLIFSTVETQEQCEKIKKACYYPPKGKRGLGLVRENFWGNKHSLVNIEPTVIVQIESKLGVENIQQIKEYNFDHHLIGPYDLSLSLGVPGDFDHPNFIDAVQKIRHVIADDKMAIHIPKDLEAWDLWENDMSTTLGYKNYGLKCIGMDTTGILTYNKRILSAFKK